MDKNDLEVPSVLQRRVRGASEDVQRAKTALAEQQRTYEELCSVQATMKWEKVKLAEVARMLDTQEQRIMGEKNRSVSYNLLYVRLIC